MLNRQQFGEHEEQLPLFLSAQEIKSYRPMDYVEPGQKPSEFWADKLEESAYKASYMPHSTYESVGREGVKNPAKIYIDRYGGRNLGQGHHRVISQFVHDPQRLVPVTFTSSESEAVDEDDPEYLQHIGKLADDI